MVELTFLETSLISGAGCDCYCSCGDDRHGSCYSMGCSPDLFSCSSVCLKWWAIPLPNCAKSCTSPSDKQVNTLEALASAQKALTAITLAVGITGWVACGCAMLAGVVGACV